VPPPSSLIFYRACIAYGVTLVAHARYHVTPSARGTATTCGSPAVVFDIANAISIVHAVMRSTPPFGSLRIEVERHEFGPAQREDATERPSITTATCRRRFDTFFCYFIAIVNQSTR
jgi:hypothetical protein